MITQQWNTYLWLGLGSASMAVYQIKYENLGTFSLPTAVVYAVLAIYFFILVKEELTKKLS